MRPFPSADTFLTKFKSLKKLSKTITYETAYKKPGNNNNKLRKCLVDFLSLHNLKLDDSIDHVAFLVHEVESKKKVCGSGKVQLKKKLKICTN